MLDFSTFVAVAVAVGWLVWTTLLAHRVQLTAVRAEFAGCLKCALAHPALCRIRDDMRRRWHLALIAVVAIGIFYDLHAAEALGFLILAVSVEWA